MKSRGKSYYSGTPRRCWRRSKIILRCRAFASSNEPVNLEEPGPAQAAAWHDLAGSSPRRHHHAERTLAHQLRDVRRCAPARPVQAAPGRSTVDGLGPLQRRFLRRLARLAGCRRACRGAESTGSRQGHDVDIHQHRRRALRRGRLSVQSLQPDQRQRQRQYLRFRPGRVGAELDRQRVSHDLQQSCRDGARLQQRKPHHQRPRNARRAARAHPRRAVAGRDSRPERHHHLGLGAQQRP